MNGCDLGIMLGKTVAIDGIIIGDASAISITHGLGSNPTINIKKEKP